MQFLIISGIRSSTGLVFNKTIIPLTLVGYEPIIADSVPRTSSAI